MRFGAITNSSKGPPPVGDRVKIQFQNVQTSLEEIHLSLFLGFILSQVRSSHFWLIIINHPVAHTYFSTIIKSYKNVNN